MLTRRRIGLLGLGWLFFIGLALNINFLIKHQWAAHNRFLLFMLLLPAGTALLCRKAINREIDQNHVRKLLENGPDKASLEVLHIPLDRTLKRLQRISVGNWIFTIIVSLFLGGIISLVILNNTSADTSIKGLSCIAVFIVTSAIVFTAINADYIRAKPILKLQGNKPAVLIFTAKGIDIPFILLNPLDWYNEEMRHSPNPFLHVDWKNIAEWKILTGGRGVWPQYYLTLKEKNSLLKRNKFGILSVDFNADEEQNILFFASRFLSTPFEWQ